jgi:four helix bundle protein
MHGQPAVTPEQMKERLTVWAVEVVGLCRALRVRPEARHLADQLLASATSVAANYRAACRARSRREFASKLAVAVEEADESVGWMQILVRANFIDEPHAAKILNEAEQLLAILAASRRTAERNARRLDEPPSRSR